MFQGKGILLQILPEYYIYSEYKNKVMAYVRKKVADTSAVEDLVEDIFMKIYENLDKIHDVHPSASSIKLESAVTNMIPMHEGAARYFTEAGALAD